MQEIKIINEVMPVIEMNFDEVKNALEETLKKYENIVVTEETLSGCKATQKELAGVRAKIDTYRKDKKKELSAPITEFEEKCKTLIALIEKAEQPIKDGIKVFDDVKREEKRKVAERLITEVAEENGLEDKYTARLEILDKYCNLTAKESEVKLDLSQKAMVLRVEQDREKELLDIIKDTIEIENQRINKKMDIVDFQRLIDRGMQTKDILAEVKSKAETIYQAENPIKEEPKEEIKELPKEEPKAEVEKTTDNNIYYGVYKITGELAQLRAASQFLKDNKIKYDVIEQGEI